MGQRIPSMQQILPPRYVKWQARLLLLSLALTLALPINPEAFRMASGVAFAVSQAFLALLLLKCLFQFRQILKNGVLAFAKT